MLSRFRTVAKSSITRTLLSSQSSKAAAATTTTTTTSIISFPSTITNGRSMNNNMNTNTNTTIRMFSDDKESHNDFEPKRKEVKDDDEALKMIHSHVTSNKIMLYMKGNPSMPMCGFSATVVKILQKEGVDFSSVNVMDYPSIREGVKKYSEWPTIPQLYVDGEFVGGCDIITSMHESGELADLVKVVEEEKKD
jgi:monothiol glutaredoxin